MQTLEESLEKEGLSNEIIHFLKFDVEGAELDVLLGLSGATWQRVQQLAVEVHYFDNRLQDIQTLLREKGFGHVVEQ